MKIELQERTANSARFRLSGEITLGSSFEPILEAKESQIILDLGDIARINSMGVREWLLFVAALEKTSKRLVLEKCSVPIVKQLNAIVGFRGRGIVASVFAPYYCESCGRDHRQLIEISTAVAPPDLMAALTCPKCGKPMEFDDLAGSYLGFNEP